MMRFTRFKVPTMFALVGAAFVGCGEPETGNGATAKRGRGLPPSSMPICTISAGTWSAVLGPDAIDVRTWSMPIAFRNLLEGESAHHPVPLSNKKGGPKPPPPSPPGTDKRHKGVYDGFRGSKPDRSHNDPAH